MNLPQLLQLIRRGRVLPRSLQRSRFFYDCVNLFAALANLREHLLYVLIGGIFLERRFRRAKL